MEPVVICGDFNIHIDDESDPYSTALTDLLQSMALKQHVCIPTQHHGHTLDLIIIRDSDNLITDPSVTDTFLSDHATVLCNLSILKGKPITRDVTFRKLKSIDLEVFTDDLRASELLLDPPTLLTDLVRSYNTTLSSLLDEHAPPCTRAIVSRPSVPWFNEEIRSAKRQRRRAERKWKLSNLDADFQAFKTIKNKTTYIMNNARREFYTEFVENNSHDQRKLFCATKKLLNKKSDTALPSYCDKTSLANDMGNYFIKKISDIRAELDNNCNFTSPVSDDPDDYFDQPSAIFSQFSILDIDAVRKLVTNAPTKTCPLDPLPTVLLKICLEDILPTLTNMLNLSMQTGEFPEVWKEALVTPILKREGLDTIFKNYRPISNLQFVSKLVERAVADQLYSFMADSGLLPELQSAYRPGHSTETALLKVKNDLLLNMDGQRVTLLVLLDLSAAFDTVDHDVLHNRLSTDFGIKGTALKWFESYLSNRRQRVSIEGVTSKLFDLDFGVPQGSCLGPLLFLLYSSKLFKIISRHLPSVHAYADDTQLYLSFKAGDDVNEKSAIAAMEACVLDIHKWMLSDRLKLNMDKTEFLLIGTKRQLEKVNITTLRLGDTTITQSPSAVKNLGAWFDAQLNMHEHIKKTCSSSFFHIYNIRRIRKYLSRKTTESLVHAFVSSKLDFCNSLLYGLPDVHIAKLQRVQNAAARLVVGLPRFCHITPVLCDLHWLPIRYRIHFKILLLTFKCLHGLAPKYLSDLLTVSKPSRYNLRNHMGTLLTPASVKFKVTLGDRAFKSSAPKLWNSLPLSIRNIQSLNKFKAQIKTYVLIDFIILVVVLIYLYLLVYL